jgi:excinuclease ABC subunit C
VPGSGRRTAEAVLAAVADPVAAGADADRVAEDAVELEAPEDAVTPVRPVHGPDAGDTTEIGRVQPVTGGGA